MAGHTAAMRIISRSINSENGLPDNEVRCLEQDDKGFIWFGTLSGLYRYDGYFYRSYKSTQTGNTCHLFDNHIQNISRWGGHALVIRQYDSRYSVFDTDTEKFIDLGSEIGQKSFHKSSFSADCLWLWSKADDLVRISAVHGRYNVTSFTNALRRLSGSAIRFVQTDRQGDAWIGTAHGLLRISGGRVSKVIPSGSFRAMAEIGRTRFFILDNGQIYRQEAGSSPRIVFAPDIARTLMAPVRSIIPQGSRLLILTDGQTMEFDPARHAVTPSSIPCTAAGLTGDNLGNYVIFDRGIYIWYIEKTSGRTHQIPVYDRSLFSLSLTRKYKVHTIGTHVWISTYGNGITVYDLKSRQTEHLQNKKGADNRIGSNYIVDMSADNRGNIWIAEEFLGAECLTPLDHQNYRFVAVNEEEPNPNNHQVKMLQNLGRDRIVFSCNGISYQADARMDNIRRRNSRYTVRSMLIDRNGKRWIGTNKQGLCVQDRWYQSSPDRPSAISSNRITSLLADRAGRVWVATQEGGISMGTYRNGHIVFRHFLDNKTILTLLQDHKGNIWAGGVEGVFVFQPRQLIANSRLYRKVVLTDRQPDNIEVVCMKQDSRRHLWIGTRGNGAFHCENIDAPKPAFRSYNTTNGLINNNVQSIAEDEQGNIWLATKQGITYISAKDRSFKYINQPDDKLRNYYTENCVARLDGRQMAFGTLGGIVIYDTGRPFVHDPQARHHLRFTDLLINGVSASTMERDAPVLNTIGKSDSVNLKHNQNAFTIQFSTFNFAAGKDTRYSYILKGYEDHWSEFSNYSFATYKNLDPGKYIFHVKAVDINLPGQMERTLTLIITPPLWATWWAVLIYFLAGILIIWLVYRQISTVYKLRNQIHIEQQLTAYKLNFFTNISHELRTPLTIIQGAMERIRTIDHMPGVMKQPVSTMNRSVTRMLRLIDQLLEFRKMQNNKLQLALQETDVIRFVHDIFLNFNEAAENKKINYVFLPFARSYQAYIDRDFVDKIVYNLISNAFKYTPANGSILLRMAHPDQKLLIEVKDTGVGIPKEKQKELFTRFMQSSFSSESTGIGLNLTQEIVKVHHGSIRFTENKEGGSIFSVELPDNKAVYDEKDFLIPGKLLHVQEDQPIQRWLSSYHELPAEPLNDKQVLIVEDDNDVRQFLMDELQRFFIVYGANDGAEALSMLSQRMPDLVITDVFMPRIDGFELTRKIRSDRRLRHLPIIILTAVTGEDKKLKGLGKGADLYLTKPFSPAVLISYCMKLILQDRQQKTEEDKRTQFVTQNTILTDERDSKWLNQLDLWIFNHLSEKFSMDDIADYMKLGRSSFFNKVRALTGMTPYTYILKIRLEKALALLRDNNLSISETAYQVGFDDPHYFSKRFKSWFGISPKEYLDGKPLAPKQQKNGGHSNALEPPS